MQDLVTSGTRFTRWRLRSRTCAAADLVAAAAGACIFLLATIDNVTSWPANHVLLGEQELARVVGIMLVPSWCWLFASFIMVFGAALNRRDRPRRWPVWVPLPWRVGLSVAALLCLAVIVGGFVVGGAKGSVRILPGPRYEVSTLDIHQASWTAVSASGYNLWQARFVREDGIFTFFGLALVVGSIGLIQLHRAARGAVPTADLA